MIDLEARCAKHWQELKIDDTEILKSHIEKIFTRHRHQSDALDDIYRMVLPDWDKIDQICGHVESGTELWKFICRQFILFDQEHHPDVSNGGIWLDEGFYSNEALSPWEICFENCSVEMKQD